MALLRNQSSGKCLSLAHGLAIQVSCAGANITWALLEPTHRLPKQQSLDIAQSVNGGLCVVHNDNWLVLQTDCRGRDNGLRLRPVEGQTDVFRVTTTDPNRCVTIQFNPDYSRIAVIRDCKGDPREQWKLTRVDADYSLNTKPSDFDNGTDGQWRLRNSDYDLCLTPWQDAMTVGTKLGLWDCRFVTANALWHLISA